MKKIFKAFKPFLLLALLCVLILIFLFGGNAKNAPIMRNRREANQLTSNYVGLNNFNPNLNNAGYNTTIVETSDPYGYTKIVSTTNDSIIKYGIFEINLPYTSYYTFDMSIQQYNATKNVIALYVKNENGTPLIGGFKGDYYDSVDTTEVKYLPSNDYYILFYLNNDAPIDSYIGIRVMLNLGNVAVPYQPYYTTNDVYQNGYNDGKTDGIYETNLKNQYGIWQYLYYVQSEEEYTFNDLINEGYLSFGTFFTERFASQTNAEANIVFYFNELPISQLDLNFLTGFLEGNYELNIYTDGAVKTFLIDNTETFVLDTSLFTDSSYIEELHLNFNNVEYLGNIVDVNNMYSSGYDVGYNYGYNLGYNKGNNVGIQSGITEGKNEILDNPSDYGLYNEEQYESYGQGQYQAGYTEGINKEAPTGLEWFRAAINVTQAFLDITILPGVSLIHIFSGFIILLILKWVLEWFRG